MGNPQTELIREFDRLIRRDPGKRGLIDSEARFGPLCTDHLLHAALDLVQAGTHVAITTGFYIPAAEIPSAETDGPPGSILLAMVLQECGIHARQLVPGKQGSLPAEHLVHEDAQSPPVHPHAVPLQHHVRMNA